MFIQIFILPQKQTVDAQGRVVKEALHKMGHTDVSDVAIGRYMEIEVSDSISREELGEAVTGICTDSRLNLVNPVMEDWRAEVMFPNGEVISVRGKKKLGK